MSERAGVQEQKGQILDFVQIFHQKLDSIPPLNDEESKKWARLFGEFGITRVGITQVTRIAESVIFFKSNGRTTIRPLD